MFIVWSRYVICVVYVQVIWILTLLSKSRFSALLFLVVVYKKYYLFLLTKTSCGLYYCNFLGMIFMGKAYQVHGRRKYVECSCILN